MTFQRRETTWCSGGTHFLKNESLSRIYPPRLIENPTILFQPKQRPLIASFSVRKRNEKSSIERIARFLFEEFTLKSIVREIGRNGKASTWIRAKENSRRRIGRFGGGGGWKGKRKGKENWSGAKGMKGGGKRREESGGRASATEENKRSLTRRIRAD